MRKPFTLLLNTCLASAMAFMPLPAAEALAADIMVDADCTLYNALVTAQQNFALANCEAGDDDSDTIIITQAATTDGVYTVIDHVPYVFQGTLVIDGKGYTIKRFRRPFAVRREGRRRPDP